MDDVDPDDERARAYPRQFISFVFARVSLVPFSIFSLASRTYITDVHLSGAAKNVGRVRDEVRDTERPVNDIYPPGGIIRVQ